MALQSFGCFYLNIKRLAVFYLDNLYGQQTLSELKSTSTGCQWNIVSIHVIEYGVTDFSAVLSAATASQVRNFIIILDNPVTAGLLMEQGYRFGLFGNNVQILGSDEITVPQLWEKMPLSSVKSIMQGYLGVHYSPEHQMLKSKEGKKFIEKFIKLPDTQFENNGTVTCQQNDLDDSGLYFLYGKRSVTGTLCSGLQFSKFARNGSDIYPEAAHVYDAVYALAYGAHDYFFKESKTNVRIDDFYSSSFFDKVKFVGATGLISFDRGSPFYPFNNRGDRRTGHTYEIYNFNLDIYSSSNGSLGLSLVGFFESENGTSLCEKGSIYSENEGCAQITYNTANNMPVTNPDVYLSLSIGMRYLCYALSLIVFVKLILFAYLFYHYRHSKLFKSSLQKLLDYTLLGCLICAIRVLMTGLDVTTPTCIAKLWLGQLGFFILYGALFRQIWSEYKYTYLSLYSLRNSQVASFKYSLDKEKSILPVSVKSTPSVVANMSYSNSMWRLLSGNTSSTISIIILVAIFFLLTQTFVGVPHFDYIVSYLNLQTTHESACYFKNPIPVMIVYAIQLAFIVLGLGLAWIMRKDLDILHEPKETLLSIILGMVCILIIFVAVLTINLSPSSTNGDKEISMAVGYALAATLGMILICWPPIFEIFWLEKEGLLIHQSLLDHSISKMEILQIIKDNLDLIYKVDRYGRTAFQVALDFDLPPIILLEMVKYFLPIDPDTKQSIPPEIHRYAWVHLVQKDRNAKLVEMFLDRYAHLSNELANAEDAEGRTAVNIASQSCQRIIKESIYFCKRYEITTLDAPIHKSKTCVVHLAVDHGHDHERVALKLMKNRDQYVREVAVRKDAKLDERYVLSVIRHYDHEVDELYSEEVKRRGFDEYNYCIVMPAADRDLNRIITNEHIAGKDFAQIKSIATEIAQALDHLHTNGIMHGDIKSKNIMRIGHKIKLIDLDACASMDGGFAGAKFSSAFSPPEMVFFREPGNYASLSQKISQKVTDDYKAARSQKLSEASNIRSAPRKSEATKTPSEKITDWKNFSSKYYEDPLNLSLRTFELDAFGNPLIDHLPYELVPANYSYDTWSLGVVMFELCAGIPLFLANSEDNVLFENLLDLYAFTDKYKHKRMLEIHNIEARNLVSQMLMKDAMKRPRMSQVLAHPFLTGRKAPRMLGESAEFDVFISYRVQSDLEHAEMLYDKLTAAGLRVWWDKKSLAPGVPWQVK